MTKLNPMWQEDTIDKLNDAIINERVFQVTVSHTKAANWLINHLDQHAIPFTVCNLGAGVRKITTDTSICPKCHGTGRV